METSKPDGDKSLRQVSPRRRIEMRGWMRKRRRKRRLGSQRGWGGAVGRECGGGVVIPKSMTGAGVGVAIPKSMTLEN